MRLNLKYALLHPYYGLLHPSYGLAVKHAKPLSRITQIHIVY